MGIDRLAESQRLRILAQYGILDTEPDETLDELVALAAAICEAPIALVSLVDDTRQWFKAKVGLAAQQTPRDQAFCAHAIDQHDPLFTVRDAREDARFVDNPLVTGEPGVVFYAGATLTVEHGAKLGTLCVIDREPRELTALQEQALATLSRAVVRRLKDRRALAEESAHAAWLETALTSIGDAVITTDERGRVTFSNPVAERLTGWSEAEAHRHDVGEVCCIVHEKTREPDHAVLDVLGGAKAIATGRALLIRRDGSELPVQQGATPIYGPSGALTGAIVIFSDQTAERELEREREDARLVLEREEAVLRQQSSFERQLIGIVSHDLRNPLNVIAMAAQLLKRQQALDETGSRHVQRIQNACGRASRLIHDLLDFTQARLGGGLPMVRKQCNVHAMTRGVIDEIEGSHPDRVIELRADGDGDGEWDADRLGQVVQNLVSNALKYGRAEHPVTVVTQGAAQHVIVRVHGGALIPADQLSRLFEPFERGSLEVETATRSVGLGLYIVREVVVAHGGTIEVESSELQGTTFTVTLPRGG